MSKLQTTEPVNATPDIVPVERVLAVFNNETEQFVAEYPLRSFDLDIFKRQFTVEDDDDPLMYNVYPVAPEDAEFVLKYLGEKVPFDFKRNAYFIECYDAR